MMHRGLFTVPLQNQAIILNLGAGMLPGVFQSQIQKAAKALCIKNIFSNIFGNSLCSKVHAVCEADHLGCDHTACTGPPGYQAQPEWV